MKKKGRKSRRSSIFRPGKGPNRQGRVFLVRMVALSRYPEKPKRMLGVLQGPEDIERLFFCFVFVFLEQNLVFLAQKLASWGRPGNRKLALLSPGNPVLRQLFPLPSSSSRPILVFPVFFSPFLPCPICTKSNFLPPLDALFANVLGCLPTHKNSLFSPPQIINIKLQSSHV